jgi:serine/threonine protein kinase/beta-lactam-binding protein with PASTA domain
MPLISDSIGRVLGRRYRLVSALGTGASAHVFLAEDVSLQRRVAVKVLQPALARDDAFLKRFEAEARSVASLNHPHILRVFDWGEDTDGPYLVLEYLQGGSLRDVLDRGFRLDHAQAARLGTEAAQGLAYAHARGLVHRDVKPANLLLDEEGRVRIADFGVARALAEAAWTEPAGAMVGTARYASPEQAQGRSVDGRSDVYSLSLVLYEALTGEVPFVADTTMATLTARVGTPLPRHPALGPLDDALARGAAPEAAERFDAARLAARLEAVGASLPPPAPLPLRPAPAGDVVGGAPAGPLVHDRTEVVPAAGDDRTAVVPGVHDRTGVASPPDDRTTAVAAAGAGTTAPPGEVFDIDAIEGVVPAPGGRPGPPPPPPPPPVAQRRRGSRWPWVAVGLVVAAVVAAGLVLAFRNQVFTPSHRVPKLTGHTLAAARTAVAADHFDLAVAGAVHSLTVPSGSVVSQDPAPGTSRKEGTTVRVVPSAGLPTEQVPTLAGLGLTCTTAARLLAQDHFKTNCPALLAYSTTVPAGQVINWSYDGRLNASSAPYGSTIAIAVSKGKPPVPVPTVAGAASYTQAAASLQGEGLQATQVQTFSTTVPTGHVVGTTPPAGTTVTVGSTVKVVVSKGPQTVAVPTVSGKSVQAATNALQQAGLTVGAVYGPGGGHVFTSVPLAGQVLTRGSAVNLYTQ